MARKNNSSDKDQELNELIADYETAKKENKPLYLDGDQLADIADRYAFSRRFDEAQEVISYGLELHPGHTDLMVEQAYLYLDTMKLQKAKNVAECITETYETEVKLLKAEILLNEGNLDEAEKLLDSIEDKESLNTILDVSYLYMDMGYPEKALSWLTLGIEEYKEEEDFLAAMADCYRSGDHDEQAIYIYNKLIDKNPYDPSYWTGLAKSHFNRQEFEKTIEACDFALAADENFGEAHLMKAHSFFHLENESKAIQEYQLALKGQSIPPEFAHMFIGLAYTHLENWELGYQNYERALKFIGDEESPILTDIYSNEAYCLSKMGRYEEAHQICERAKEKTPESAELYLQEGYIYLEEKEIDKAKESWKVAIRCAPEAETLIRIGNYYLNCNMLENARMCLEEAKRLEPEHPSIDIRLASLCLIQQDYKGFEKYNQLLDPPLNLRDVQEAMALDCVDGGMRKKIDQFIQEIDEFKNEDSDEDEDEDEDENEYPDEKEND